MKSWVLLNPTQRFAYLLVRSRAAGAGSRQANEVRVAVFSEEKGKHTIRQAKERSRNDGVTIYVVGDFASQCGVGGETQRQQEEGKEFANKNAPGLGMPMEE